MYLAPIILAPLANEPPEPARSLSDPYRGARRVLSIACAVALAWAAALIDSREATLSLFGVSVRLSDAPVPFLLFALIVYLSFRWIIEYTMMPRDVRRWRLARIDFRLTSWLLRLALVGLAIGAIGPTRNFVLLAASIYAAFILFGILSAIPTSLLTERSANEVVNDKNTEEVRDNFHRRQDRRGYVQLLVSIGLAAGACIWLANLAVTRVAFATTIGIPPDVNRWTLSWAVGAVCLVASSPFVTRRAFHRVFADTFMEDLPVGTRMEIRPDVTILHPNRNTRKRRHGKAVAWIGIHRRTAASRRFK
jgi:hypothetical protein